MNRTLSSMVLLALACNSANAELQSRLSGQAYYDTLLGITWITDGNLVATNSFGVSGVGTSTSGFGAMTWYTAQEWIAAMNTANYLGVSDWRLHTHVDTDGPDADDLGDDGCNVGYVGTDCGWNPDPAASEIAHLYYITLGNPGSYDPDGVHQDWCDTGLPAPPACLINVGPFSNFFPNHYWTGSDDVFNATRAWEFNARIGLLNGDYKTRMSYAWAVRDGDIDSDEDGVVTPQDNCTLVSNPVQCDSDGDGFGNRCDGDLNNNGATNAQDTSMFRPRLGLTVPGPVYDKADLNCNGVVNAQDTSMFRQLLGQPPGPSGLVP